MGNTFSVEQSLSAGIPVLRLRGDLDLDTAPALWAALEGLVETHGSVVLNLAELAFIDSSGLSLFVRATNLGCRVVVAAPQAQALTVLRITALDRLVAVCTTEEEAVAEASSIRATAV